MRHPNAKRALQSTATPIYCYETDLSFSRVIRDPMAALLGRSTLSVQQDADSTDPYNRIGRFMRGRWSR